MTTLSDLRALVVTALNTGDIPAADYVGETITPPCAAVVPSEPYMELMPSGGRIPFGTWEVGTDVLLISHRATAKQQASLMDDLILKALAALDEFDVQTVSRPGVIKLQGASFMATAIRVVDHLRL